MGVQRQVDLVVTTMQHLIRIAQRGLAMRLKVQLDLILASLKGPSALLMCYRNIFRFAPASFYYSRRSVPAAPKGRGEHRCSRSVQKRDLGAPTGTARSGREPHHYVAASPQAGKQFWDRRTDPIDLAGQQRTCRGHGFGDDPPLDPIHLCDPAARCLPTGRLVARLIRLRSAPAPRGCWPGTEFPDAL